MNTKNYYVTKDINGKLLSVNTNLDKAWESVAKTGGFITPKTIDDKEVKEFLENEENRIERKENNMKKYSAIASAYGTVYLGEFEANSKEEAIEMALEETGDTICLCHQCSRKISDVTISDEDIYVEEINYEQ